MINPIEIKMRRDFVNFCLTKRLYYTLGLFKQCIFSYDETCPSAMIALTDPPRITIGPMFATDEDFSNYAISHELYHILQISDLKTPELNKKAANVAADIALNEMILGQFTHKTQDYVSATLCTRSKVLPDSEPKQSLMYYYNQLMQNPPEKETTATFDIHDFCNELSEVRVKEMMAKAEIDAKQMQGIGNTAGDAELFGKLNTLSDTFKKAINAIKVISSKIKQSHSRTQYSFLKYSKHGPDMPAAVKSAKKVKNAVLLLDTSGSMFGQNTIDLMYTMTQMLLKRGVLDGAYCFDTELHDFSLTQGKFIGGGGTTIDQKMLDLIAEKHGKDLDLILLSDMEIHWALTKSAPRIHKVTI